MIELLQRTYRVNIAGQALWLHCSTVCKCHSGVWLSENQAITSGEFSAKSEQNLTSLPMLRKTQQRIETANDELNKLSGVPIRQMQKQLRKVAEYDFDSVENNDN